MSSGDIDNRLKTLFDALELAKGTIIPSLFHPSGKKVTSFRTSWKKACKATGVPGKDPSRLPANSGQKLGARRGAEVGGDEDGRASNHEHLFEIRHRGRGDAQGRGTKTQPAPRS